MVKRGYKHLFMLGKNPTRRTLGYLEKGKIDLRSNVAVVNAYYRTRETYSKGLRDFVYWYFPQIQYKNPNVQLLSFVDKFPSPFIQCFLSDGREVLFDVFDQDKQQIFARLNQTVGKTDAVLQAEARARLRVANPSNFGEGFPRHCMCEVTCQYPCPGLISLPIEMRGKYHENPFDLSSPLIEDA